VPPGGHCEGHEDWHDCALREFLEETGYHCRALRLLTELEVDDVPFSPPLRLRVFWDVYDGQQEIVCREGQALAFVSRSDALRIQMPRYLVDLWDRALTAWRDAEVTHISAR
jgi:8-oxo-dGTP pyrophosphatase MutT (NUDIX family)